MRFNTGVLGVVIVVIALLGTVLAGFVLNVTPTTHTATSYDYVTDVSGLFDYTEQADYIEYSPAKNLTGYSYVDGSGAGVDYVRATVANQYMMKATQSSTNATLPMSGFTASTTISPPNGGNYAWAYESNWSAYATRDNTLVLNPSIMEFSGFISAIASGMPTGTTSFSFTLNSTTFDSKGTNTNTVGLLAKNTTWTGSSFSYSGTTYTQSLWPSYYVSYDGSYTQTYKPVYTYDVSTGAVTYEYTAGGQTMTAVIVPDDYYVLWGSNAINDHFTTSLPITHTYSAFANPTNNVYVTYYVTTYEYLNPAGGVTPQAESSAAKHVLWSNGYTNGVIDIAVDVRNTNALSLSTNNNGVQLNTIHLDSSGLSIDSATAIPYGTWSYVLLRIDAVKGVAEIYPIVNFSDYNVYTVSNYVLASASIVKTAIDTLNYDATCTATLSVASTTVAMKTKLMMVNPSLNITSSFPDTATNGYRLNFYSFVTYGTSITVNGHTYAVADGKVTISTGVVYDLRNIYVEYKPTDGHVYLVFVDERQTVDTGAKTSDTVSMAGTWYFTTGFWQGVTSTETVYESNWANCLTGAQSLLVFLGLLVLGTVIGWKYLNMKIADLAIIVGASVIIYALLEVFT